MAALPIPFRRERRVREKSGQGGPALTQLASSFRQTRLGQQSLRPGDTQKFRDIADLQTAHEVEPMSFHGAGADAKTIRDLLAGQAFRNEADNFFMTRRDGVRQIEGPSCLSQSIGAGHTSSRLMTVYYQTNLSAGIAANMEAYRGTL